MRQVFTIAERKRYNELKARMRLGEMIPREDFLFVRGKDQRQNARNTFLTRSSFVGRRGSRDTVIGGFGTI